MKNADFIYLDSAIIFAIFQYRFINNNKNNNTSWFIEIIHIDYNLNNILLVIIYIIY